MNNYLVEEYLLKVIHPRAYSPKARLLHLPDRFGRILPIKFVDEQLPGRRVSTQVHSPQCVFPNTEPLGSLTALISANGKQLSGPHVDKGFHLTTLTPTVWAHKTTV